MVQGKAKHAWFRRLGVDVWVRRSEAKAEEPAGEAAEVVAAPPRRAPATMGRATPERGQTRPAPVQRSQAAPEAPSRADSGSLPAIGPFTIRCLRFGDVFAAIAEDAWPRRRFLLDVMRAMNGFRAAKVQSLSFDWPQPGVSADSRPERAFAAFAGHQMEGEAMRRVVSGAKAAAVWGLGEGETATRSIERGVYVHPGDESPEAKQALWRLIAESKPPSL